MVQLEIIFVASVFLLAGAFIALKPDWYIRSIQWQTLKIWNAEFKATKKTEKRMRIFGVLFFIIGLAVLYAHLILGKT